MKNRKPFTAEKRTALLDIIGFSLISLVVITNLTIAINFYFLRSIKVPAFFFQQVNKNEEFNPKKRY